MKDFFAGRCCTISVSSCSRWRLAVGLWLAVARDPVAEVAVEVPIEFRNIPENLEISSESIPRAADPGARSAAHCTASAALGYLCRNRTQRDESRESARSI